MNLERIQNVLEDTNIEYYKYLGTLTFRPSDEEDIVQWYWQEDGGMDRVIYLSININKHDNEIDCLIGDNRGFIDTIGNNTFVSNLDICNEPKLKEWIKENLYNIGRVKCALCSISINHMNAWFRMVWKRLGLGKYEAPGWRGIISI